MISNLSDEVWKTKEAKLADDPLMGKALNRGITLEAMTAVTLLLAGADILVMRHPKAIELVRNYVADLAGVARPISVSAPEEVAKAAPGGIAAVANLPRGIKLDIDIAKIMNAPLTVGADHVLALVKVSEDGEGGITVSPEAVEAFSAFLEAKKAEVQPAEVLEGAGIQEKTKKKVKEVPQVKILHSWAATEDKIGEFNYPKEKKKDFSGKEVELLGPSYEEGTPTERGDWRQNMKNREDMVQHLKTSLRYWYSSEVYGSEKRKTPA
jgi:rRNA processing protein Krr1/Pno1